MEKKIFLLGGHDLEMSEIRNLLNAIEEDVVVCDRCLNWSNAELVEYLDVLQNFGNKHEVTIFGIELREQGLSDIPKNYRRIDHHNDLDDKKSSLEQVADLLGIRLDRYLRLVAANDSGYIPEMQKSGATQEEIVMIRRKDREIQGVTENDEKLAGKAISEKQVENDMIIVKAYSSRFSPICDRLYPYDKLLIYTDDELIYYGKGKKRLENMYESDIAKGKIFHGGGENGYIGTVNGAFSKEEILSIKENIVSFFNS